MQQCVLLVSIHLSVHPSFEPSISFQKLDVLLFAILLLESIASGLQPILLILVLLLAVGNKTWGQKDLGATYEANHTALQFCSANAVSLCVDDIIHSACDLVVTVRITICTITSKIEACNKCLCMYVCMYVCICVCMYVCMYYVYVCMYICIYVCMYVVRVCVCMLHTYTHTHTHINSGFHKLVCIHEKQTNFTDISMMCVHYAIVN